MFENIKRKPSSNIHITTKNNSTSLSRIKKNLQNANQNPTKIFFIENQSAEFDKKKVKSLKNSKEKVVERKSIDAFKNIHTTRSSGRKNRERARVVEQVQTESFKPRHENFLLTNLNTQKSTELKWIKKVAKKNSTEVRSIEKKRLPWNERNIPYNWQTVVENFGHLLTRFELSEIKQYKKVYYIGHKAKKREKIDLEVRQPCFDNKEKQYEYMLHDHIAYRYEILGEIGKGSYGQVVKVFDHKTREELALKIIKNEPKYAKQAFIEIKILTKIKELDEDGQANVVRIKDFVIFRKHVCLLFEMLSENLYELIARNNYNGLNLDLIRRFAIQILGGLQFLRFNGIIHCDLKPENILLKEFNKSGIKLIDFGSSCFKDETIYTYIQSRYYRAPEITLGIKYDMNIDMWSVGCIFAELYTGMPLFPGENEKEQVKYITDTLGGPPSNILNLGFRKNVFFSQEGRVRPEIHSLKTIELFSKPLKERIDNPQFLEFIESFLKWNPAERITPIDALNHVWVHQGLPRQLRNRLTSFYDIDSKEVRKDKSQNKYLKKVDKKKEKSWEKKGRGSQERIVKRFGLKL